MAVKVGLARAAPCDGGHICHHACVNECLFKSLKIKEKGRPSRIALGDLGAD
jgi:hypothetical protein